MRSHTSRFPLLPEAPISPPDAILVFDLQQLGLDADSASALGAKTALHMQSKRTSLSRADLGRGKIPKFIREDDFIILKAGSFSAKVTKAHYEKLKLMSKIRLGYDFNEEQFLADAFCVLVRYGALLGSGLQAACPAQAFDVLARDFGVSWECFASPLNAHWPNYCSAFYDVDAAFGSVGSFFDFYPTEGCFQANPPFEPQLVDETVRHMLHLLDNAKGPLMFIFLIPSWKHAGEFEKLKSCSYLSHMLQLKEMEHVYFSGSQHRDTQLYRLASFNATLYFLQNSEAHIQYPVTEEKLARLKAAFLPPELGEHTYPFQTISWSGIWQPKEDSTREKT